MGGNSSKAMEERLMNLKITVKQLQRNSARASKDETAEKAKVKKAIEQGNMDGARIYAQNAIRKRNEAMNCLRLSSRIDAVASRIDSAVKMNQVTESMRGIVKSLGSVLSHNLNIDEVSQVMEKFEKQFEELDVAGEYMESAMASTTAMVTPEDQVNALMEQVADEHGLELGSSLNAAGKVKRGPVEGAKSGAQAAPSEADELSARLSAVRSLPPS